MTKQNFSLTELSAAVGPARERHREPIDAATAWLSARDHCVDPDHLALICAAADEGFDPHVTPTRWTRTGVYRLVRCDIPNWCSMRRTLWPETVCEIVWHWFDFLHDSGRMDPHSDPVAELRKPLACYAWLDQDGRRLPPGAERQIACECFLPYRETADLLGAVVRGCEYSGEDPLDVLRRAAGGASGRARSPDPGPWR